MRARSRRLLISRLDELIFEEGKMWGERGVLVRGGEVGRLWVELVGWM